ncbi:MAG: DUF6599 family protein [Candidatus Eisenbacteria bacterium]
MNTTARVSIAGIVLLALLPSCGGSEDAFQATGADFLPSEIVSIGWSRAPEIRSFAGDSLFEYINGAAEMYHKYGFVDVEVADYNRQADEIIVDLYRFTDPDMAFGLFTTLRPYPSDAVNNGVAGFSLGSVLVFVKGRYVVNLTGYDESEVITAGIESIAAVVDSLLPGTSELLEMFALIPQPGRIPNTEKVFAESFLGRGFLTKVYTVDCRVGADTVTVFVTDDVSGEKLLKWSDIAVASEPPTQDVEGLPFDDDSILAIVDSWHGLIVAGPRAGKLVGIVGYNDTHRGFLVTWLDSLDG